MYMHKSLIITQFTKKIFSKNPQKGFHGKKKLVAGGSVVKKKSWYTS